MKKREIIVDEVEFTVIEVSLKTAIDALALQLQKKPSVKRARMLKSAIQRRRELLKSLGMSDD